MFIKGNILLAHGITNILSGSSFNVTVLIENEVEIFIEEIYLTFLGTVQVKWQDLNSKNKDGQIIYFMQQFEGQEVCVERKIIVETSGIFPAGRHSYNFMVTIPQNIPETFIGNNGSVKYELILMMRDNVAKQRLYTLPVTIQRCLNNITKELMLPLTAMHRKYFCFSPCNSKPIITTLTLSSASFIPGDIVKYYLLIENCTKYFHIRRITAVIVQTQKYTALKPKQRIKQDHCTLHHKMHRLAGMTQNSKSYIEGSMQLSKWLASTSMDPCLIMTSYTFQVIIIMNGLHTDGYMKLPLVIRHHISSDSISDYVSNELRLQMDAENIEDDNLDLSKIKIIKACELNETIV